MKMKNVFRYEEGKSFAFENTYWRLFWERRKVKEIYGA